MSELIDRGDVLGVVSCFFEDSFIEDADVNCAELEREINRIPTIAAPRWVRCEERMPEKNGAYLVFIGYGDNWIWFKDIYKDGKFMADTCALNGAKVTHWMPIEPPGEDA